MAADDPVIFTEKDYELLKEMAADYLVSRNKSPNRPFYPERKPRGPEVYVARTPASGVPAMVEEAGTGSLAGTGTEVTDPDRPGSAVCAIYRLLPDAANNLRLTRAGFTHRVYNLNEVAIPGSKFVVIIRDKFGAWWLDPGCCATDDSNVGTGTGTGTDGTGGGGGGGTVLCCGGIFLPSVIYLTVSAASDCPGIPAGSYPMSYAPTPGQYSTDPAALHTGGVTRKFLLTCVGGTLGWELDLICTRDSDSASLSPGAPLKYSNSCGPLPFSWTLSGFFELGSCCDVGHNGPITVTITE